MNFSQLGKGLATMAVISVLALSGCQSGEIKFSDDTKKNGIEVMCGMQSVLISQLGVGGAVTKGAAGIIADNATDEKIVKIAKKVQKGNMDKELIKELKSYVKKQCK